MALLARLRSKAALMARPQAPESLPVSLDRRRVYVLPTGFGLFAGGLVGVMLLGALNYNNNPALLLALLLAATLMASLMAAHLQLSGLRADAIGADVSVSFVSPAALDDGLAERLGLARTLLPVAGTRDVGKAQMRNNDYLPRIDIDPESFAIEVDGELVVPAPADRLPLAQLYSLF